MQVSQHRHMRFGGAICGLGAAYGVKGRGRPLGLWEKMEMLPLSVIPGKIFQLWKILEIRLFRSRAAGRIIAFSLL